MDVNFQLNDGSTALIHASKNGYSDVVRTLLNHEGVDVNIKNKYGSTAVRFARYEQKTNCDKDMYDYFDDEKDDVVYEEVVRALLIHGGSDVTIQNNDGDTALIDASRRGHLDVVRALLNQEGVEVNIKDTDGNIPIILASYCGHLEVVRELLRNKGIDVNIKDNDGNTALIDASRNGNLEVVRALLNHEGVDVNI